MSSARKNNMGQLYLPERLKTKLDKIWDFPCTVIESPLGYGKTTSLNAFLLSSDAVVIWQSMCEEGLQKHWDDLCHAMFKVDEICGQQLQAIGLPSNGAKRLEVRIVIESMKISKRTVLVLDNYHLILSEQLDRFWTWFLSIIPKNLHVVIMGRHGVLKISQELMLKGHLYRIDREDFLFGTKDIEKYFQLNKVTINATDLQKIQECSEGWVSALNHLILSYKSNGYFEFSVELFQMIKEVIYDLLDEEQKRFLKTVCILEDFSIKQASYLWEKGNSEQLLEQLITNNAFIQKNLLTGKYTLHNLFKRCLRIQLKQEDEMFKTELWSRSGQWHLDKENYWEAITSFYKAKDFDRVFHTIAIDCGESIQRAHLHEFIRMYNECPMSIKAEYPHVLLLYALILKQLSCQEEPYETICSEFEQCLEYRIDLSTDEIDHLLEEYELLKCVAGSTCMSRIEENEADALMTSKFPSNLISIINRVKLESPSSLFLHRWEPGSLKRYIDILKKKSESNRRNGNAYGFGNCDILELERLYYTADFENAEIEAHSVISMAKTSKRVDILICALYIQVKVAIMKGDVNITKALLQNMKLEIDKLQANQFEDAFELVKADIYSSINMVDEVEPWIYKGEYLERTTPDALAFRNTIYGKVLLMRGGAVELWSHSAKILEQAERHRNFMGCIYNHIQMAVVHFMMYRDDQALESLIKAMDLAMHDHIIMPFVENAKVLNPTLLKIQRKEAYGKFARSIVELGLKYDGLMETLQQKFVKMDGGQLSDREREIAELVIEGCNNKTIAERLNISHDTVKRDIKGIFRKTNINSRSLLTKELILN